MWWSWPANNRDRLAAVALLGLLGACGGGGAPGVSADLRLRAVAAPRLEFPLAPDGHRPDSNGPAIWLQGTRYTFHSYGWDPVALEWPFRYRQDVGETRQRIEVDRFLDMNGCANTAPDGTAKCSIWLEATWQSQPGSPLVYGFYHHEQKRRCGPGDGPVIQRIGGLKSSDGGLAWTDLGVLIEAAQADWRDPATGDCRGTNPAVGGGNGDFSVVADRSGSFLYFVFTQGSGPAQGIAMARLAVSRLDAPRVPGEQQSWVDKWNGRWVAASGIGGAVAAVLTAPPGEPFRRFDDPAGDNAFWGPSVHYNPAAGKYVALLNHSRCDRQEARACNYDPVGIWYSWTDDLASARWATPRRLLALPELQASFEDDKYWYPQVLGEGALETDALAGPGARLYVHGVSLWTLEIEAP
jgi:hypothetical protein